jgi:hypothetical protein
MKEINYETKINQIIDEAVENKTFSLEIITKIKTLKDDFDVLTEKYDRLEKMYDEKSKAYEELYLKNRQTEDKLEHYINREGELVKRESQNEINDLKLKHEQEKSLLVKEMFNTVFRNPVVRESVYRNKRTPINNNGYVSTYDESENETITREEE